MDPQLLSIAIASFIGTLLVVSRVGGWVLLLRSLSPTSTGPLSPLSFASLAPLVLHSGPWILAVALAGIYYAATSSLPGALRALLAGALLATGIVALGVWRSTRRAAPQPLTPSRLLTIRRRFFWGNSLFFALASSLFLAYGPLDVPRHQRDILVLFGFFIAFAGGWAWSWFMWQWYGEQLKVKEQARLKRKRADGT